MAAIVNIDARTAEKISDCADQYLIKISSKKSILDHNIIANKTIKIAPNKSFIIIDLDYLIFRYWRYLDPRLYKSR